MTVARPYIYGLGPLTDAVSPMGHLDQAEFHSEISTIKLLKTHHGVLYKISPRKKMLSATIRISLRGFEVDGVDVILVTGQIKQKKTLLLL